MPGKTLKELVRISRDRVVLTTPYGEQIRLFRCVHCAQLTPVDGHLHAFNKGSIRRILPDGVRITRIDLIGNKALCRSALLRRLFLLPIGVSALLNGLANYVFTRARWMMVIVDKE